MKKNTKMMIPWLMYAFLVGLVCFILSAGSCSFTSEGITMLSGDYESPTLETFILKDPQKAMITFSTDVSFPLLEYYVLEKNLSNDVTTTDNQEAFSTENANLLGTVIADETNSENEAHSQLDVKTYTLSFPYETSADLQYILSGTVKDSIGSTLSFALGFSGYNSRVPKIIFSEISTEYSKPRTEFVEFYVLEDGNLAGILLHSANDGVEKDYIFPSVEVAKGEYIVLHMRTVEEGAVNELGDNISLSNTKQSSTTGRDLWIPGTETRFSKNDVLLLRERLNGTLLDAVAYTDGLKSEWPKDLMQTYIQEATDANLWEGGADIALAANIEFITGTRTFSRQNILEIRTLFDQGQTHFPNSKDDWIIVATSNLSPGKENSRNAYSK